LAEAAEVVGVALAEAGRVPAGLAHVALAQKLDPEDEETRSTLRKLESDPSIPPSLKNPYRLSPVPDGLDPERATKFAHALAWADQGLWSPAAAAFDTLSAQGTPESDRNLGLCRLWLADHTGAVEALRRYTGWIGPRPDTVDLEALCQLIAPIAEDDRVDLLQWIWPIRNRDALTAWLGAEPLVHAEGTEPVDPNDPKSPEVDVYLILTKPPGATEAIRDAADIPRISGRLLVGREIVALEAYDDGRLDRLADWFREKAGAAIPPAHPRTKRVGRGSREAIALRTDWLLPEGIDSAISQQFSVQERERVLKTVWPETPMAALGGRTPRRAAQDGNAVLQLRAALCLLETGSETVSTPSGCGALGSSLGLQPELQPDPATVVIDDVPLHRLHAVPAAQLDDERLFNLFARAQRFLLVRPLESAAEALVARPALLERKGPAVRYAVYGDLSNLASSRGQIREAFDWLERGRREEPFAHRQANAAGWDLLELRLRARTQAPEEWVPFLAALLERHRDSQATTAVLSTLAQMGLVQFVPNPDKPGEMYIDTRTLQAVVARYGPRITTASGELGVSAAKPGIWTPGSETGRPQSGIWTPGSDRPQPPSGEPSKIIITGR
jgi:hypothetical protein